MKRTILSSIVVLLFLSQDLPAQESREDVIYLRNGSVVRGMICEIVPGKSISIQSSNQFVYTFAYEQIERIRIETRQLTASSSPDVASTETHSASTREEGGGATHYTNTFQLGVLTNRQAPLSTFGIIRSADVGDFSSFGFGIGWDSFGHGAMLPLFVDMRSCFFKGLASPFIFADAGYSLGIYDHKNAWEQGGFVMNAGAGFVVRSFGGASFVMQASYRLQRARVTETTFASEYFPLGNQMIVTSRNFIVNREYVMVTVGLGF